jgi:hypothetical protein
MNLQLKNEKEHRKDIQAKGNWEKKRKRRTNENETTDIQVWVPISGR